MFSPLLLALTLTQAGQDCPSPAPRPRPFDTRAAASGHPDESESFEFVFAWEGGGGKDALGSESLRRLEDRIRVLHQREAPQRHRTDDHGRSRLRPTDSHHGYSSELSVMIPVVRFPRPRSAESNYLRIYAEPGVGVRTGKGLGTYASGKVMLAWLSDQRVLKLGGSPFVEVQGRLMGHGPYRHDIRIIAGAIVGLCKHCGFD